MKLVREIGVVFPVFFIDTVVSHPMYNESSDYEKLRGNYYDTTIVFMNYDTLTLKEKRELQKKRRPKCSYPNRYTFTKF